MTGGKDSPADGRSRIRLGSQIAAAPSAGMRSVASGQHRPPAQTAENPGAPHRAVADESADVVGVATLFDGFEQAFARWQEVERAPQGLDRTFIALFEVLEWTACIDERLETKRWISAPHLRGIRWARNRCHHDWALALEVRRWDEEAERHHGPRTRCGRRMGMARAAT